MMSRPCSPPEVKEPTITLTDVVLGVDGGADIHLPDTTWSADVGWLPG